MSSRIILISLDLNHKDSEKILKEYAINYYRETDQIVILSIYNFNQLEVPIIVGGEDSAICTDLWKKSMKEFRENTLNGLNEARELLTKNGIPSTKIDTYSKESTESVGESLCHVAEEIGADIIIMGKHHKSAISRVLMGSVSTHVVHHSNKTVILINLTD